MSIHHLEAAAEYELHATSKLVLMALCDDANKITRVTFPGRPKLRLWAGVDDRRVQAIIEELIVQGLLARREFGMPGRNAEFLVFPTDEELEALDTRDPDLNAVSQAAIDRVMKADEAKTRRAVDAAARADERAKKKAAKATTQPVDNSETVGASQCTHADNNGCISDTNGCTPECTPPVSTPEDLTKSHRSTHLTGAVDNAKSDDASNHIHPTPKPATTRRSRTLDTAALAASVGGILADTGISDDGLRQLGHRIIAKASAVVVDPTAYVTQAIRRHPTEWRAEAFDIAQGSGRGMADNGAEF